MPSCSVRNCKNYSRKTKGSDIQYYSFPKDHNLCNRWLLLCKREQINIKTARICSIHFSEASFEEPYSVRKRYGYAMRQRYLKPEALPTQFVPPSEDNLPSTSDNSAKVSAPEKPQLITEMSSSTFGEVGIAQNVFSSEILVVTPAYSIGKQEGIDLLHENLEDKELSFSTQKETPATSYSIVPEKSIKEICETEKYSEVTCMKLEESSSRVFISSENPEDTINYWTEKYSLAKQEIRILQEKIEHLNAQIDNYNEIFKEYFTPGQIKQITPNKKIKPKLTGKNTSSAISLGSINPNAYIYLRDTKQSLLSGEKLVTPTTLTKWTTTLELQPDVIREYEFSKFIKEHKAEEIVRTHPCPICTKEFSAVELRQHVQSHKALKKYLNIPLDKKIKMGMHFYVDNSFSPRRISIHKRKQKLHKCVMCNEEFNATDLRVHLNTHRNQKEYHCDQCERVFKKMNHLNTHRVKHLKEFPFKCEKCNKGFVIKTNYECHILTHNGNQELPYECSQCLKRFYNPEHLNRHMVSHTENVSYSVKYRVFKCYHCLKTFKDRDELKLHQCVPVKQAVNVRYPCKDCKKMFKNAVSLYNHKRNIHKLKGTKILCSVCGIHVSDIYIHMLRHTGERPHQCTQCGKRFIRKQQLRQHLLVHSGLKPFTNEYIQVISVTCVVYAIRVFSKNHTLRNI